MSRLVNGLGAFFCYRLSQYRLTIARLKHLMRTSVYFFMLLLDPMLDSVLTIRPPSTVYVSFALIGILVFQMRKLPFAIFYQNWLFVQFGCVFNALIKAHAHSHLHSHTHITQVFEYSEIGLYLLVYAFFAALLLALFITFVSRNVVCFLLLCLSSIPTHFDFTWSVCIFIGKYYIEMLMSETFFQSSALLDCIFIGRELISLCLAFASRLLVGACVSFFSSSILSGNVFIFFLKWD